MADKSIVSKSKLTALGDAIRSKTGTTASLTLDAMASEIANISMGITPTGTLEITENGTQDVTNYASVNVNVASSGEDMLQAKIDATNSCAYLFYRYTSDNVDYVSNLDTSRVTNMAYMFYDSKLLKAIPKLNTSKVTNMEYFCRYCETLTEISLPDTSKVTDMECAFEYCKKLTTLGVIDMSSANEVTGLLRGCYVLTNLTLKNIKVALTIGSGYDYGHLLTLDSLVNTIKELVDTGSSKTLTMGSANLKKIANVYVRLTGEAEEVEGLTKLPCEVCNETDEGAMLITAYANLKNWSLA